MKKIAVLPSLLTLGNLLFGFAAVVALADARALDGQEGIELFALAAWFILLGMVCDGLDGRVARAARVVGPFGAQLDSLADLTTFGLAPALLVRNAGLHWFSSLPGPVTIDDFLWWVGGVFIACAALRLARFNAQHGRSDPAQHDHFRGLPTPAAAGIVASLVLFACWAPPRRPEMLLWAQQAARIVLPAAALVAAVLMVTTVRYVHVLNLIVRDRKPFRFVVGLIFLGLLLPRMPRVVLLAGFAGYLLSGPILALIERFRAARNFGVQPVPGAGDRL